MATAIDSLIERLIPAPARVTLPITVTFKDASKLSGLSESHLRFLASDRGGRKLATSKVGRKRLVEFASLQSLIKS
jgi:hypothetical protein